MARPNSSPQSFSADDLDSEVIDLRTTFDEFSVNPDDESGAFAALKRDGSVIVWGQADAGGNNTGVDLSQGVVKIYSNSRSFSAIRENGSVASWGDVGTGVIILAPI